MTATGCATCGGGTTALAVASPDLAPRFVTSLRARALTSLRTRALPRLGGLQLAMTGTGQTAPVAVGGQAVCEGAYGCTIAPPYFINSAGRRTAASDAQLRTGSRALPRGARVRVMEVLNLRLGPETIEPSYVGPNKSGPFTIGFFQTGARNIRNPDSGLRRLYRVEYDGPSMSFDRSRRFGAQRVTGWVNAAFLSPGAGATTGQAARTGQPISRIRRVSTGPRATCSEAYCRVLSPDLRRAVLVPSGTNFGIAAAAPDGRYVLADRRNPARGNLGWATFDNGAVGWVSPDEVSLLGIGTGTGQAISRIRRVPTPSRFDAPYGQIATLPPAAIIEPVPVPVPAPFDEQQLLLQVRMLIQAVEAQAAYAPARRPYWADQLEAVAAQEELRSPQAAAELRAAAARIRADQSPARPPTPLPPLPPLPPGSPGTSPMLPSPPPPRPNTGQVFSAHLTKPPRRAPTIFTASIAAFEAFDRAWDQGLPPKVLRALWRAARVRAMELYGRDGDPGEQNWAEYEAWWNTTHRPTGIRRVATGTFGGLG